jgi:hypothetical protein
MLPSTTQSAVVYTKADRSAEAGMQLGQQILTQLPGEAPDAVILFISPKYEVAELLRGLSQACRPKLIVGCTSAGEFTHASSGEGQACALALRSSTIKFAAGIGRHITRDRVAAAKSITAQFKGTSEVQHAYSAALVLTDALAGHADELIEELTVQTGGNHQFFGGGAGDDANFKHTQVFCNGEVATDAAVALEILSPAPIGVGVRHGWYPASRPMRVTEVDGMRLISLNSIAAVQAFRDYARESEQSFDEANPTPFLLHNILGIETGHGYKLRVPLAIRDDGSIVCAAEIPEGATVCIMATDPAATCGAAADATRAALDQLLGRPPQVALFFDCVATRLRMGREFGAELSTIKGLLGNTHFAGCNTYGQVARTDGQFSGFHNCTAVVCVLSA